MKKEKIEEIFDNLNRRKFKYDEEHYKKTIAHYFLTKIQLEEIQRQRNNLIKSEDSINMDIIKQVIRDKRNNLIKSEDSTTNMDIIKQVIRDKKIELKNAKIEYDKLFFPNMLDKSVPDGIDAKDNHIIHTKGEIKFSKHHYKMPIFHDVSQISGSRFSILKSPIAKLERALITYAMKNLEKLNFTEFSVPYLMRKSSAFYTHHEKELSDMFTTDDKFLIPTGENQLLCLAYKKKFTVLPWKICTVTDCFRKEAGAAGQDTKGLIRLHQFKKCEMVVFSSADKSYEYLEEMTRNTENLLELLQIPYRRVLLCSGDIGYRAAKTYDIEVPIGGKWREVASISNCTDYQSKRLMTKFNGDYPHILNGTYLAVGRTLAALLEHYFDSTTNQVHIPACLHSYLSFKKLKIVGEKIVCI